MHAPATATRPTLRRTLLKLHRWLSLGAAVFWLLQALTGVLIVFHWEITDASISSLHRPTDLAAIERRVDTLVPPGGMGKVGSIWSAAGAPGSVVDSGPPERITAFGFISSKAASAFWNGTISE